MKIAEHKNLLDAIPAFVFTLNTDGVFLFVNRYSGQVLGYHPSELEGKRLTDIALPAERVKVEETLAVCQDRNIGNRQRRIIKKNGATVTMDWSGRWDPVRKVWYCYGQVEERQEVSTALQQDYGKKTGDFNRELSSLLDRTGEGFAALDEEGRVIYWNRQAEEISGKAKEEVLAQKIWECYPEMSTPQFCDFYSSTIERQVHQHYEAFYPKEGKWIEIVLHPGKSGVTAFFRDITEQKKNKREPEVDGKNVNKKVTAAVIQAQENERTKISRELHDNVNQVLTTVKLYVELCSNDLGNKELMQRSMTLLQSCIDEIRALSRQLSAPSLGKISLKDSLKDLVKSVADSSKTKIQLSTKGIEDVEVNEELHLAIYRILQEHLANILQHAEAKKVRITIKNDDEDIVLKVTDDGKGFDLKQVPKGIGIDNMTSRAESLGGRLIIETAPGSGCVLTAHFPKPHQ
jgi:PAS domain S-box-containing protein